MTALLIVVLGSTAVVALPGTAAATTWTNSLSSTDQGAYASFSYDPASRQLSGYVLDLTPYDGACASFSAYGYGPLYGWATRPTAATIDCVGAKTSFSYAINFDFSYTVKPLVCNGPSTCTTPSIGQGCTAEMPIRYYFSGGTKRDLDYLRNVIVCSDHAESRTRIINKSDVVWSLSRTDLGVVIPIYVTASGTSTIFRTVRPDGGTNPLALPGETVDVLVRPSLLRWTLDEGLSLSWLPMDTIVDTLISKVATSELLTAKSKPLSALAKCAVAFSTFQRTDLSTLTNENFVDVLRGVAGVGAAGLACNKGIAEAVREAGGKWPHSVGLDDLELLLGKAEVATKVEKSIKWMTLLDDLLLKIHR